jgi:DNA-binding SARP family transcriptional activator
MLEVRFIGKFEICCDGEPVVVSSRIAQSLFAYLILTGGTQHRREKLAGMFWPDTTEEKARAYLRHELWRIRKALSNKSKIDYLITDDINISFKASAECWLDVTILKGLSESASPEELMKGLSLFHEELLPGFYDDWITQEREYLQTIYEKNITRLLELLEQEKRWNDILEWAEHWISFDQGAETAYRNLMIAYDALGDRAKVTSTYQRCVQALRELDLEPSEQTRVLAFKRNSKLNIPIPRTSLIGHTDRVRWRRQNKVSHSRRCRGIGTFSGWSLVPRPGASQGLNARARCVGWSVEFASARRFGLVDYGSHYWLLKFAKGVDHL